MQGFEDMHQACLRAVATAAATPRDRLIACGLTYVRFGLDNPKLLVHLFTSIAQAEVSDDLVQAGATLFGSLQQLVHEGQTQGAFRSGDTQALSHACWAMVHGLAALLSIQPGMSAGRSPDRPDTDALMQSARAALDLFLDSLTVPPARP